VGVKVCVAYSRNKRALRTRLRNLNFRSRFSIFDCFRDIDVHIYDILKFVGGLWALKSAFLDRWIGIDKNNTFQLQYSSIKTVGATVLGGLWALEWAYHFSETNLRCVRSLGICVSNPNSLAFIVSDISAFIWTDGQTDRRTWLDRLG